MPGSMQIVGASEANTHLAALLDAVNAGEQISITRLGRPLPSRARRRRAPSPLATTIACLRRFSEGQTLGNLFINKLWDQRRRSSVLIRRAAETTSCRSGAGCLIQPLLVLRR